MSDAPRIIGLSGTNGSGKDTVGRLLAEHRGYMFVSVTDIMRDELRRRGLSTERANMRALSAEWRREFGLDVLVDRAVAVFEKNPSGHAGIVMASLRNPFEADRVHDLGGIMVWIDAEPHVRYARVTGGQRAGRDDDRKTYEQFMAEEQAEMRPPAGADAAALNMAAVKARCDVTLINDGNDLAALLAIADRTLGLRHAGRAA